MKKIIALLFTLSMMFSPNLSHSQGKESKLTLSKSQFIELARISLEFSSIADKLKYISDDLSQIAKALSNAESIDSVGGPAFLLAVEAISESSTICDYESEVLQLFIQLTDNSTSIEMRQIMSAKMKERLEANLRIVQNHYPHMTSKAASRLFDQAKEIIRSSLQLMDKSRVVIESAKKSMKQKE